MGGAWGELKCFMKHIDHSKEVVFINLLNFIMVSLFLTRTCDQAWLNSGSRLSNRVTHRSHGWPEASPVLFIWHFQRWSALCCRGDWLCHFLVNFPPSMFWVLRFPQWCVRGVCLPSASLTCIMQRKQTVPQASFWFMFQAIVKSAQAKEHACAL